MSSAELVNLILAKLRRVEFLVIQNRPAVAVRFRWGGNQYTAKVCVDDSIDVYRWVGQGECRCDDYQQYVPDVATRQTIAYSRECRCDNYQQYVQDILNGLVRNDDGEMVKPC